VTTLQSTDRLAHKVPAGTRTLIATLGALIAVGATILFLALPGTTKPVARRLAPTYYPLIQYRGTGAPPVAPATAQGARPTVGFLRAEHSYGPVP
jgi:hypothetical protein